MKTKPNFPQIFSGGYFLQFTLEWPLNPPEGRSTNLSIFQTFDKHHQILQVLRQGIGNKYGW